MTEQFKSAAGQAPPTVAEWRLDLALKSEQALAVFVFGLALLTAPSLIACLGELLSMLSKKDFHMSPWPPGMLWWGPAIAVATACLGHAILLRVLIPPNKIAYLGDISGFYRAYAIWCGVCVVCLVLVRIATEFYLLPILAAVGLLIASVKLRLDDNKLSVDALTSQLHEAQWRHEWSVAAEFLSGYWKHIAQLGDPALNRPPATSRDLCLQYRHWCARNGHKLHVSPSSGTTDWTEANEMGVSDPLPDCRQEDIKRCAAGLGRPFWRLSYDDFVEWCRRSNEVPRGADVFGKSQTALRQAADRDTKPFEEWFVSDGRERWGHDEAAVPSYERYLDWCEANGRVPEHQSPFDKRMTGIVKERAIAGVRRWLEETFHAESLDLPRYEDYAAWCACTGRQLADEAEYQAGLRSRVVPLAKPGFETWLKKYYSALLPEYEEYAAWCGHVRLHALTNEEFRAATAGPIAVKAVAGWQTFRGLSPDVPPREVYAPYRAWCVASRQYVLSERDVDKALAIEADPWSYGSKTCPTCKGKSLPKPSCQLCHGSGRVNGRYVETGEREFMGYGETRGGFTVPLYHYKDVYVTDPCSCTICTNCRGRGAVRVKWPRVFKAEDIRDRPAAP